MDDDKTVRERMNERERLHHFFLCDVMKRLEYDLHDTLGAEFAIPRGWEEIASRAVTPPKKKVCMRVDEDVLKFFRATGSGFQTRMNDVLRAYMHSRLSRLVRDGARFERYVEDRAFKHRPEIGDEEELDARLDARAAERRGRAKRDG